MLNLIPKEPHNLFDNIFTHYNKLFNMSRAMFSKVPRFIQNVFMLTENKSIDGYCIMQDHGDHMIALIIESNSSDFDKITDDSEIYNDEILFDGKIYVISVINESLLEDDEEPDSEKLDIYIKQIKGLYRSFDYVISSIFGNQNFSTFGKTVLFAPRVMTFKLITQNLYNNEYVNSKLINDTLENLLMKNSVFKMYIDGGMTLLFSPDIYQTMYDFSVEELLDKFGIIAIKNGNEEILRDLINPEGL